MCYSRDYVRKTWRLCSYSPFFLPKRNPMGQAGLDIHLGLIDWVLSRKEVGAQAEQTACREVLYTGRE